MKIKFSFTALLLIVLQLTLLVNCKKDKILEPVLNIAPVSNITYNSATSGGTITNGGGALIESYGICWNTSQNPTTKNSTTYDGSGLGSYVSHLTGLEPGKTYYVKAYATNSLGIGYSSQLVFTTLAYSSPSVTTTAVNAVTTSSAQSGGNITSDGGTVVTSRGVCWNIATGPTILLSTKTSNGSGTGIFISSITGLTAGTTYYVRAYATNSVGTVYGSEETFTSTANLPELTTSSASAITATTAACGGDITVDGGATVSARGVCWSTTTNPTVSLSTKTTDGSGPGTFTSSITGLTTGTTYYLRAYATNSAGTAYGALISFKTLSLPVLTTTTISLIKSTTATSGGNISSDGGAAVIARGVCWSTTTNPTIILSTKTSDGSGIGSFASSITGLTPGLIYYLRSYATNSVGTAYGTEVSFKAVFSIGEAYQGGIVAYVDNTGLHGLISASNNLGTTTQWGCGGSIITGADGIIIGTGNQNTADIVAGCLSAGIAARICFDYSVTSAGMTYSDWYLPSRDELNYLYLNRTLIGGFISNYYWSSSEVNGTNAMSQSFSNGTTISNLKNNSYYVRPVRTF